MSKIDKAMRILLAGFCINLCLGILYAWSVFNKALVTDFGWSAADASSPYAIATIAFSVCLLVAGILQDRMGPRNILILGTTLTGLGMIASGFASSVLMLNLTFGVMTGAGIGFGYACLSPSAMKWFHPVKRHGKWPDCSGFWSGSDLSCATDISLDYSFRHSNQLYDSGRGCTGDCGTARLYD